ncbi:MAG: hypothetical protein PW789_10755 [Edaphobacter sp.]|uniref:hypothetical protein n=1 Tax=Edaphobacter sp. TaxID=1934404 RepID=UPI002391653E|nr:hypothetical protein [Edaphobacter sp.]MDE1177069.1 hypothetical protein [Edaphobacter sp.]
MVTFKTLQFATLAALFVLLYAGRMIKGKPRETTEGLAFPLKPIVIWGRALVLPLYFIFFALPVWKATHHLPMWLPLLIVAIALLVLSQMPGTIVMTPSALVQHFWLRGDKRISYHEVMSAQAIGGGRMTRIMGDNRVTITHTWNHSGAAEFAREIERRTNRRVIR